MSDERALPFAGQVEERRERGSRDALVRIAHVIAYDDRVDSARNEAEQQKE